MPGDTKYRYLGPDPTLGEADVYEDSPFVDLSLGFMLENSSPRTCKAKLKDKGVQSNGDTKSALRTSGIVQDEGTNVWSRYNLLAWVKEFGDQNQNLQPRPVRGMSTQLPLGEGSRGRGDER